MAQKREAQELLRQQREEAKRLVKEKKKQENAILNAEVKYNSMAEELDATKLIIDA